MGLSMKSSGSFTRLIEVRSFTSIMPPSTMPKMIGTLGKLKRRRMKPNRPKTAAIAQSVALLRSE